jgi:hypothetical protein
MQHRSREHSPAECLPVALLEGLRRGFGVDLCRLKLCMSQELLDLLQGHAAVEERLRNRMAREVRIHRSVILASAAASFTICWIRRGE